MRTRWLSILVLAVTALLIAGSPAPARDLTVAQEAETGGEQEGQDGTSTDNTGDEVDDQEESDEGGEGSSDADAETGAGEGEQEEAATEEGPPWTYQMARITLVLVLLLFAMMGLMYWRLVGRRARGA